MDENEVLLEKYKNLDIKDKRRELGRSLSEMTIVIEKMINDIEDSNEIKNIDNYDKLFDKSLNESEYLDCLYEEIFYFKEKLGKYLTDIVKVLYVDKTNNE